jgi:hypothetical protein
MITLDRFAGNLVGVSFLQFHDSFAHGFVAIAESLGGEGSIADICRGSSSIISARP